MAAELEALRAEQLQFGSAAPRTGFADISHILDDDASALYGDEEAEERDEEEREHDGSQRQHDAERGYAAVAAAYEKSAAEDEAAAWAGGRGAGGSGAGGSSADDDVPLKARIEALLREQEVAVAHAERLWTKHSDASAGPAPTDSAALAELAEEASILSDDLRVLRRTVGHVFKQVREDVAIFATELHSAFAAAAAGERRADIAAAAAAAAAVAAAGSSEDGSAAVGGGGAVDAGVEEDDWEEEARRAAAEAMEEELRAGVRVAVRIKPSEEGGQLCVLARPPSGVDYWKSEDSAGRGFNFDRVLAQASPLATLVADAAPLVPWVLSGRNATLLSWGETGSGKSYTLRGGREEAGAMMSLAYLLFQSLAADGRRWRATAAFAADDRRPVAPRPPAVTVTAVEVLGEEMRDLLRPAGAAAGKRGGRGGSDGRPAYELRRDFSGRTYMSNLVAVRVRSMSDFERVAEIAFARRTASSPRSTRHSAHAHCLITLQLRKCDEKDAVLPEVLSSLRFVDLAGSEKLQTAGDDVGKEDTGLLVLADVLAALASKSGHLSYRNSRLTYALQDVLTADSATLLVVSLCAKQEHAAETAKSLLLAHRIMHAAKRGRRKEEEEAAADTRVHAAALLRRATTTAADSSPRSSRLSSPKKAPISSRAWR
eukprot:PLAT4403.1.p1 GENE.PLAT4403.1~~PLAT4403.1.p1  ORF type:complete len:721 (+),score=419.19 PLAT4403.1:191-2164(+)